MVYNFQNVFLIGQNLNLSFATYSFAEILIFFWITLVDISCFSIKELLSVIFLEEITVKINTFSLASTLMLKNPHLLMPNWKFYNNFMINIYMVSKLRSYKVCTCKGVNLNRCIKKRLSYKTCSHRNHKADFFCFLTHWFGNTYSLMYKTSMLFVYIFAITCWFFQIALVGYVL